MGRTVLICWLPKGGVAYSGCPPELAEVLCMSFLLIRRGLGVGRALALSARRVVIVGHVDSLVPVRGGVGLTPLGIL